MVWGAAADIEGHAAPLADELRDRIARTGPMPFREFMDAALYHPRYGYYHTSATMTGRGGDYVTSPEAHPVFGGLVGRHIAELWRLMSSPAEFAVVEQGAGSGALARDIIGWARREDPAFADALRYQIVEPAPQLEQAQRATLSVLAGDVTWGHDLPARVEGCLLSNELLDAFPVHRVVPRDGELHEVFVGVEDGRFVDVLRPLTNPAIAAYFDAAGVLPGEGCYAEVNLDALEWIRGVAASLRRGYVLTFDYGYDAPELYAPWRRDGTLLCIYRHAAGSDPYQRIGRQDITSSVDFTSLQRAGDEAGLRTIGMTDQASFLVRMGIADGLDASAGLESYFERRSVMLALTDAARLGRIRVLLQGRGVPNTLPRGFTDG